MEPKHTPEPWEVIEASPRHREVWADNGTYDGLFIVSTATRVNKPRPYDVANVQRIVACVNACTSIPNPEAIPELVSAVRAVLGDKNKTKADHAMCRLLLYDALAKLDGAS